MQKEGSSDKESPSSVIKIVTWNVASLRARWGDNFGAYVKTSRPDILCVQETKLHRKMKESLGSFKIPGYKAYFSHAEKAGYSGTAIYTKIVPKSVKRSFNDPEGRCITMEFEKFFLVNTYCVNAGEGLKTLDKKKAWNARIEKYIRSLGEKKCVIWTGDMNVAHTPNDIWCADGYDEVAGFTPCERSWFDGFLKSGYVDVFRKLYPDSVEYTFFDYQGQAKQKNLGWRIDYFITGVGDYDKLGIVDCVIERGVDGSDHLPVSLFLDRSAALSGEEAVDKADVELLTDCSIQSFFAKA